MDTSRYELLICLREGRTVACLRPSHSYESMLASREIFSAFSDLTVKGIETVTR